MSFVVKRNWPDRMTAVSTKQHCQFVWNMYLNACICSSDLATSCDCPSSDLCREELQRLLGDEWHEICRKEFVNG